MQQSCPQEGDPSLHCSHPWAFARAAPGTKERVCCRISLNLQTQPWAGVLWLFFFMGGETESRRDRVPPSTLATGRRGQSRREFSAPACPRGPFTLPSSGIYGFAWERTGHPDKIETFYGVTKI